MPSGSQGARPNLIVIGALKAGTTSLHSYLDAHPDIGMSQVKELDFFIEQGNLGRGLDWYWRQFDARFPVRGEASPRYAMRPATEPVAERMAQVLPGLRVIYMVRDPIERLISNYEHWRRMGLEFRTLEDALDVHRPYYVEVSRYRYQLEPFLKALGQDRVLVVPQERLRRQRMDTLRGVFSFAGVDPAFQSPRFEQEWLVGTEQSSTLAVARSLADRTHLRQLWPRLPLTTRQAITRALNRRRGADRPRPQISDRVRAQLTETFAPDVEALRALTGDAYDEWSV